MEPWGIRCSRASDFGGTQLFALTLPDLVKSRESAAVRARIRGRRADAPPPPSRSVGLAHSCSHISSSRSPSGTHSVRDAPPVPGPRTAASWLRPPAIPARRAAVHRALGGPLHSPHTTGTPRPNRAIPIATATSESPPPTDTPPPQQHRSIPRISMVCSGARGPSTTPLPLRGPQGQTEGHAEESPTQCVGPLDRNAGRGSVSHHSPTRRTTRHHALLLRSDCLLEVLTRGLVRRTRAGTCAVLGSRRARGLP